MTPRNRGFALLLVIWALVLLSSLAAGFAFAVRHEIRVAADTESMARAEAAATAALHTGVLALSSKDPEAAWRPDGRTHAVPWPGARITVRARSEGARIDINRAPPELLAGLFEQLFPDADSQSLADAIVDWRDSDDRPRQNGAEREHYFGAGYGYGPSNRPFRSVNELSQVIGFDGTMLEAARHYLTTYSGQSRINARSADLVTLTAVPGIDRDTAQTFIALRELVLAEGGTPDYTLLRNGRRFLDIGTGGKSLSLDIQVRLDAGMKRHEQAIIRLDRARGYELLARRTRPFDADQEDGDR